MFGVKINEFDNSDGKLATFNSTFPNTPLSFGDSVKYVEIGDINYKKTIHHTNVYERVVRTYDKNYKNVDTFVLDFGEQNFYNNEDFLEADNVRFKYFAKDLEGNLLAKAYNCEDLAEKIECHVSVIKRRLVKPVTPMSKTKHLFNVTRKEL